jgi:hypothetical protein
MQHQDSLKTEGEAPAAEPQDPVVARLRQHPDIAAVIDAGDPLRLWEVLREKRKVAHDPALRQAIDAAMKDRRSFLAPLNKAPTMHTINGIGTRLYGNSEPAADGTYISTLFFTVVFLPIYPFSPQYLVRSAGGNSYQFFGYVPPSETIRSWRRFVRWSLVAGVAAAAIAVGLHHTRSDVHYVNALDVPVRIAVDKEAFTVGAHDRVSRSTSKGRHAVRVTTADGRAVDEGAIDVPAATDVVAYNVLGAAPLAASQVIYASGPKPEHAPDGQVRDFCGEKLIVMDDVAYVFTTPASEIEMPQGASTASRWHFELSPGGWPLTIRALAARGRDKEAAAIAQAIWRAEPDSEDALGWAAALTQRTGGAEALLALAREMRARTKGSLQAERTYQQAMITAGKKAECLAEYREQLAAQPDSAQAAYLVARLEAPEAALAHYQQALARHPDDAFLQRGCAYELYLQRRFAEALPHFEKCVHVCKPEDVPVAQHAQTLAALGRAGDAARLVAEHADARNEGVWMALLYAHLAALAGEGHAPYPADHYFANPPPEMSKDFSHALYLVLTGAPLDDKTLAAAEEPARTAMRIDHDAQVDLEHAVALAKEASPAVLSNLDPAVAVMLAAEMRRRGDAATAERIADGFDPLFDAKEELKPSLLSGEDRPGMESLGLDTQAALRFVRGRAATSPAERKRLYAQARRDDIVHGIITRAMDHWPDPR